MQGANDEPLSNVSLTTDVVAALTLAATRRGGRPVGTGGLLAALVAGDAVGAWSTIQLRATWIDPDGGEALPDPDPAVARGVWRDVPLTGAATDALTVAAEIARAYDLHPLPPGALALGLAWHVDCGAARGLLAEGEVDHRGLLDLIQDELVGAQLEGLESTFGPRRERIARSPGAQDPTVDGAGLPQVAPPGSPDDLADDLALSRLLEIPATAPRLADHLARCARGEEDRRTAEQYANALADVATVLQALHDHETSHLGLRPETLVVDERTGRLTPTPPRFESGAGATYDRYTAPERRAGEVGPSVDQYALGVIARELLTARGMPRLTTPVRKALARATANLPRDRFSCVRDFGTALVAAVADEAPHGVSEWLARMPASRRATFTPIALFTACAITSMVPFARESTLGVPLTVAFTGLVAVSAVAVASVCLSIVGSVRRRLRRPNLSFVDRPLVPLVAWVAVTAYLLVSDDGADFSLVFTTLLAVWSLRTLLAPPRETAGAWLIAMAARWDQRHARRAGRRLAITVGLPSAVVAVLCLPAAAQVVAPTPLQLATAPLSDYHPLVAVAVFRALLGERDLDQACDRLMTRRAAGPAGRCRRIARLAAAVQDADPATGLGRAVFGGRDTGERYVVQEVPTPGAGRAWNVLTRAGHDQAGFMATARASTDHLLVQVSRDRPTAPERGFRSIWLYDVVAAKDGWRIAGYRACDVGGPGSGRQDAKCAIKHDIPARVVHAIETPAERAP